MFKNSDLDQIRLRKVDQQIVYT